MTDESNPRSLAYQLMTLDDHIETLPRTGSLPAAHRRTRASRSRRSPSVRLADVRALSITRRRRASDRCLDVLLAQLELAAPRLAESLTRSYSDPRPTVPIPRRRRVRRHSAAVVETVHMRYRVTHVTSYTYEDAVSVSHNEARVTPRRTPGQAPGTDAAARRADARGARVRDSTTSATRCTFSRSKKRTRGSASPR